MFLFMTNVAFAAIGDSSVTGGTSSLQSVQGLETGAAVQSTGPSAGYPATNTREYSSAQQDYSRQPGGVTAYGSNQALTSSAPQITGPYQESLSAEDLRLASPQADSFRPDENLGFVSATPPSTLAGAATYAGTSGSVAGSGYWYYPGSVISPNRFYVQVSSGLGTVGGCSFGGYLPLWADISSGGNLFVYEWYPGQSTPTVGWWGWTWAGFKKGWFYADAPGWHILCYNCRDWSNYVYIYVYPSSGYSASAHDGSAYYGSTYSAAVQTGPAASSALASGSTLPAGAPTPPNPNSESLALPDYSKYTPYTGQAMQAAYSGYPSQKGYATPASTLSQSGLLATGSTYPVSVTGTQAGFSSKVCTTCTSSGTTVASGVSSSYPYQGSCPTCATSASGTLTAPYGYAPQSYQAVYPTPSTCRCNEYYVQYYPTKISTVAGMYCGEWLPLWSKISRPGVYWSYEWAPCNGQYGYYCSPEVKNFGYKSTGWYQTWFRGNNPGWHILSFYCNDWSNYVYIYVWPAD